MSDKTNMTKVIGALLMTGVFVVGLYVLVLRGPSDENLASNAVVKSETIVDSQNTATPATSSAQDNNTATQATTTTATASSSTYKDGTYTVTASYSVPHDTNKVQVTLVIEGDTIKSVSTSNEFADQESSFYVSGFKSSISGAVVGKKLSGISLSRVGGASLTTRGFMEALDTIKSQAKA